MGIEPRLSFRSVVEDVVAIDPSGLAVAVAVEVDTEAGAFGELWDFTCPDGLIMLLFDGSFIESARMRVEMTD